MAAERSGARQEHVEALEAQLDELRRELDGVERTFERAGDAVTAHVMVRDQLRVPVVSEVTSLVFGCPVTVDG